MTEGIKTLKASGGDYTDPQTWWDTECATYDCTTNATSPVLECYNDWPTGLSQFVDMNQGVGYAADVNHHPIIRPASGEGHNGIPQSGFHLKVFRNYNTAVLVNADYALVDGIDAQNTASFGRAFDKSTNGQTATICNSIGKGGASVAAFNNLRGTFDRGNLAWGGWAGFANQNWNAVTLRNCVAANCNRGFYVSSDGGGATLKNCVAYNNTTNYVSAGAGWASSTNNAASDGATNTPPGFNPLTTDVVSSDFVDAANDDYHLSATSQLIGDGANL